MTEGRPIEYQFRPVTACDMCGAAPDRFELLGVRLNRSQGLNPKVGSGTVIPVKKCRRCDLIFADPQPIPLRFEDHYGEPDEYWPEGYFDPEPGYFGEEIATAKRLLDFKPNMRALDVGAGIGKAMRALTAAGFDTFGFEPSAGFRAAAIERSGIAADRLALAGVENADYPPDQFDFITFGAVLEHLRSPSHALERALEWLNPGGIIQAEVPSSRWLISRLVNHYYRLRGTDFVTNISPMHRPYHLFEFGLESFQKHGERAGYHVAEHRYMVCTIPHLPRLFHPVLRRWMERYRTGMQLTVFLRKRPANAAPAKA